MFINALRVFAIATAALMLQGTALGRTAHRNHVPLRSSVSAARPEVVPTTGFVVLRQDLFDRNNPNNLRSDWPAPPAQPAQSGRF